MGWIAKLEVSPFLEAYIPKPKIAAPAMATGTAVIVMANPGDTATPDGFSDLLLKPIIAKMVLIITKTKPK